MLKQVSKLVAPSVSVIPKPPDKNVSKDGRYHPGKLDIWMLGVSVVLGGQYFGWNIALVGGIYTFIIATVIETIAYILFCWSVSEASGALPFAGGAYGLARCTIGFFPAYLIGCFQILQYIFSVAIAICLLMPMILDIDARLAGLEPLLIFLFYAVTLLVQLRGGRLFWGICWIFSIFGIGAILLYSVGNVSSADFQANALPFPTLRFIGGIKGFIQYLPFTSWFYVGIEALNLASAEAHHPKTTIPIAQMSCMAAMVATSLMVGFISISIPMPGGIFSMFGTLAPLNNGFMRVLKVSDAGATAITILPTYGVAFGFMWAYARLIKSMASSGLLPRILAKTTRNNTPWVAQLAGSIIGYGICIAITYYPIVIYYIFPITMLFSFLSYAGQCVAYILLRLHFPVMKQSTFKSPFGIPGAVISLMVWILCSIGVLWTGQIMYVVGPVTGVASLYYAIFARTRQTFSEEENRILLTAHVSRFNAMKRKVKMRNSKTTPDRRSAPSNNSVPSQRNSVDRRSARGSGNQFSVIPEHRLPDMAAIQSAYGKGATAKL